MLSLPLLCCCWPYKDADEFFGSRQPPTPSTALGVDETQRTTATPVALHIVPPAAIPAPFMPVNNAVQPSSAAPAASTATSAAVNAPTRAAVTRHSHAQSPQAPDSKVPPSDRWVKAA